MRINFRLPGTWHHKPTPQLSCVSLRLVGIIALVLTLALIIITTSFQSWALSRHSNEVQEHETLHGHRKTNIAVSTDINNPVLHYGVVIDCGSSGSRVYVYFWPPHPGNPNELLSVQQMKDEQLKPVVKKIEPGLSSTAEDPSKASEYLRPLLDFAAEHVPKDKLKETPLYIMATAGLRMLTDSEQGAILQDLRLDIPKEYDFVFGDTHAEIISGKQEGVYAWIALNYALGKFDHSLGDDPLTVVQIPGPDLKTHIRKRTVGVIDMGGGSMQIAFEVPKSEEVAKNLLAEFNLGCADTDLDHSYRVYVTTFLGFGGNAARKRYDTLLIQQALKENTNYQKDTTSNQTTTVAHIGQTASNPILDPCLPVDMKDTVTLENGEIFHLKGSGNYLECQINLIPLLNKNMTCSKPPCSMNGIFQPSVDFRNSEFYGFSELYYTMEDVLRMSGKYEFMKYQKAAKEYCGTKWSTLEEWYSKKLYPRADFYRFRTQCFKSAWMTTVLHEGLGFPKTYKQLTSINLLNGREIHWTLGALLYKIRFYPLSDIQKYISHHYRPPWVIDRLQHAPYLFVICFIIVVAAIIFFLRRLRIVPQRGLSKVPSMSYFMTDPDQMEEGITSRDYFS